MAINALILAGESQTLLRNKLVAEAFYLTGNIEKYGSGFIRIRKALLDYPEVSFMAEEMCGGVCLTFTQTTRPESHLVTPQVQHMLAVMQGEVTRQQLMELLSLKDRKHFSVLYLQPGVAQGVIELTIPDKPNSRLQKYRLTQAGKTLLSTLNASKQ